MKKIIKKYISVKTIEESIEFKNRCIAFLYFLTHLLDAFQIKKYNKIIYLMSPTHSNIGDAAIALGARKLIDLEFPNSLVLELTDEELKFKRYFVKFICNKEDLVFFHGGGNLGDWYPAWELLRENVLKLFKNRKVILLPQTISFGNREDTRWVLSKAKKVYSTINFYRFFCRDKRSQQFVLENFGIEQCLVAPDTALCLDRKNDCVEAKHKNRIILCLRQDIEKARDRQFDQEIIQIVESMGYSVYQTDTIHNGRILPSERDRIVTQKINELASGDIVITDRYHGIILSYLAAVPCIALGNKDNKVRDSMKYFEGLQYIKWAESIDDIKKQLLCLKSANTSTTINFYKMYFEGSCNGK